MNESTRQSAEDVVLNPSVKTTVHVHQEAHDLYRTGGSLRFLDCVNVVNTKQRNVVRLEVWSSKISSNNDVLYGCYMFFTRRTTALFFSPVGKTHDNL